MGTEGELNLHAPCVIWRRHGICEATGREVGGWGRRRIEREQEGEREGDPRGVRWRNEYKIIECACNNQRKYTLRGLISHRSAEGRKEGRNKEAREGATAR